MRMVLAMNGDPRTWSPLTRSVAAGALVITVVTIVSRLLGLLRWGVQASQVGSQGAAEAYAAANLIPNILFEVVAGGALAGAVIPVLAGAVARKNKWDVSRDTSALLTWTLVVLVPVALAVAAVAPQLVGVIPRVAEPDLAPTATYLLRVFAVQIPLYGLGVVASGALQAHRRFFWPALAPALSSVVVMGSYLIFGHLAAGSQTVPEDLGRAALAWLAWGSTAGVAALSLPLLIPLRRCGVRLRPTFSMTPGQAGRARRLAAAGLSALLAQQISVITILLVVNRVGDSGAFPVFQYAQAVSLLPYAVLAVPLATSTFPTLATLSAEPYSERFSGLAAASLRGIMVVALAGAAAIAAAAGPVEALFGFTTGGAAGMATALEWLAPSLVGLAVIFHSSRMLYGASQPKAAAVGASVGWLLVAGLTVLIWVRSPAGGTETALRGVGLASSIGLLAGAGCLVWSIRRLLGGASVAGFGRVTGICGATAIVVVGLLHRITPPATSLGVGQGLMWSLVTGVVALGAVALVGAMIDRDGLRELMQGRD